MMGFRKSPNLSEHQSTLKVNACTVRCELHCCFDAGVWRYLKSTTKWRRHFYL